MGNVVRGSSDTMVNLLKQDRFENKSVDTVVSDRYTILCLESGIRKGTSHLLDYMTDVPSTKTGKPSKVKWNRNPSGDISRYCFLHECT